MKEEILKELRDCFIAVSNVMKESDEKRRVLSTMGKCYDKVNEILRKKN